MSYWDDSSDILQKGKENPNRVFPKPSKKNPSPVPEGAKTYTPATGQYGGVEHTIVNNTPSKTPGATGLSKQEQESQVYLTPPRGRMSYVKGPTGSVRRAAVDGKTGPEIDGSRADAVRVKPNVTADEVKTQHEKDRPSAFREVQFSHLWGGGKDTPHSRPIPSTNSKGGAFRTNIKSDLGKRQNTLRARMNSIDSKFAKNNGVLSSSGQTFKKLIERLSPSKQREIMATYSAPRMRALSRSDKFQLAGLPTRFQGPKDYKKNAGFYYNPNGYEYALSLQKDRSRDLHGATKTFLGL